MQAVLTAHLVLVGLAAVVGTVLATAGVDSSGRDESGRWTGPPSVVPVVSWAVAVLVVVVVIRWVGPRHPERLAYWALGTACWGVVPVAWLTVAAAASAPETAAWYLMFFALSPYGLVFLVPALVLGAVWTAVLARMNS